ncbi:MAG: hypothetical protein V4712_16025 [Pseudomonadota bacterium]
MIGASKILTVSYGTFSCTLEGFDEPFNTMKAIAEYFRDLAAEDRYFGAEPPTPDAAMLHRIAEREIQRRVEAKIDANGVVLRAGDVDTSVAQVPLAAPVQAAPVSAAPVADDAAAPVADLFPDQGAFPEAASDPVAELPPSAPAAPSLSATIPEGVAAKLARIRQSVATAAIVALPEAAPLQDEYSEDEHAGADLAEVSFVSADFETVDFAPAEFADAGLLPDLATASNALPELSSPELSIADNALPSLDSPVPDDALPTAAIAPAPLDATADIAVFEQEDLTPEDMADLAALDGDAATYAEVVAEAELADAPVAVAGAASDEAILDAMALSLSAGPATQDEPALPPADPVVADFGADDLADLISTLSGDTAQDRIAGPAATDPVATDAATADSAVADLAVDLADFDADMAAPQDVASQDLAQPDLVPQDMAEDVAETQVADLFADDPDVDFADDAFFAAVDQAADQAADAAAPQAPAADPQPEAPVDAAMGAPQPSDAPLADKAQRARARVIKIRRADAPVTAPAPASTSADLSPEAEAALQAELGGAIAAPEAAPQPTQTMAEAARLMDAAAEDAAVARLLRQADTEMAVDENRRRLSAIAHLKAAVAATVADRKVGAPAGPSEEQRIDPYREDLARAVRPQRPRSEAARSPDDRPAGDRPAPLVLVSEQRIDRSPAPAAPAPAGLVVRPRRISSSAPAAQTEMRTLSAQRPAALALDEEEDEDTDNIFADARGFAEFADRLGATQLPDLMEAAAAYVACVEKREHFSRPQLMRRIGAVGAPGELSREDGLISFGTLLRNGRFAKVRRGQYALSEDSDYLAEARRIAK